MAKIVHLRKTHKQALTFTTPEEVKALRRELNMSANAFGAIVGLDTTNDNHGRVVRKWEAGDVVPSGPARRVMQYLSQGMPMGNEAFLKNVPPFVFGGENQNGDEVLVCLHYPRFVAVVSEGIGGITSREIAWGEYLNVIYMIDPASDETLNNALEAAVEYIVEFTQESLFSD